MCVDNCKFVNIGQMPNNFYGQECHKVNLEECQICGSVCIKTADTLIRDIKQNDPILFDRINRFLESNINETKENKEIRKAY